MDFCGWSWEENKLFEMALAVIDEDNPDRWKEIISVIGGKRSEEEVKKHYEALLRDLNIIESGMFDQEFGEAQDCTQDITLTGDEQKLLTEPSIGNRLRRQCFIKWHNRRSSNL